MTILLISADKHGKMQRKKNVDLHKKGFAVVKSGIVQQVVEVKKSGSLWELWAHGEGGARRQYGQGLYANDAWLYCLDLYSIDESNIK